VYKTGLIHYGIFIRTALNFAPSHCPTCLLAPKLSVNIPSPTFQGLCECVFQQTQGKQCAHDKACHSLFSPPPHMPPPLGLFPM
ncbi:mCG145562, partial [Mus musculus]